MADYAHELTDSELTALEKKIAAAYERARDKVQERADKFFDTFREDAEKLYKAISDAPDATTRLAAEKAYKDFVWRNTVAAKNITDLRDKLAADMTAINQRSAALIGNRMNGVFSLNHNFAAYTLEHDLGLNLQFTLYDEFTVARLLKENPKLLPKPKIDVALDKKWNAQKITSEITQGILTGESIPKIADRLQNVTDMNRNSAIRNARTAITGAENAGRIESYHYAESIGITLQKEWLATLDDRTRDEHRALDGQRVDVDEPFEVDGEKIMFPGDPNAEGYLVFGCRCSLISAVEGVKDLDPEYRRDNISGELIDKMNYREWESAKKESKDEQSEYNNTIISGQYKETPAMNEYDYFSKEQTEFRRDSIEEYTGASKEDVNRYLDALCGNSDDYNGIGNNVPSGWFYGADRDIRNATSGEMYEKAKTINEFIEKSPKFEGEIFRGLSLDENTINSFSVGNVISETGNLSSWTSSRDVAEMFAQGRSEELGLRQVLFVSENPAYGTPAAHLSLFGSDEKEVIVSNMTNGDYIIKDVKTEGVLTIITMSLKG